MQRLQMEGHRNAMTDLPSPPPALSQDVQVAASDPGTGHDATSPTEIPPSGWWPITKRIASALTSDMLWVHCGCVGFFGFLSIFPILAIFVLLYGIAFDPTAIEAQIAPLEPVVPDEVYDLITSRLEALTGTTTENLTLGIVISTTVALWTGSRGTNAVIGLLNLAYHQEATRSFVRRLGTAIALTFSGLLGLIVILITVAAIPIVVSQVPFPRIAEIAALWGRWPILAAMIFVGMSILYRFAPNRRKARWRWIWPGALVATILWMALSILFSIYVERFDVYGPTFGTLSVAAVLMLWIYYSSLVLGIGAIINAETELQTRQDSTVGKPRPRGERGAVVADTLPRPVEPAAPKPAE